MRCLILSACALALAGSAHAAPCPGNPNALGVSRVLPFSATDNPLVGSFDYGHTLPLNRGEVVLTFDDGPLPPHTNQVLKALADECVKAVFFMVGRQAQANPELARQVAAAGHTIGTHSQNHPLHRMAPDRAKAEIDRGIASIGAALGSRQEIAPLFRFPGLFRTAEAEHYLRARRISAWSIDIDSDDWRKITPQQVLSRTLSRLESKGRGIILMHDIQPRTAHILPVLLSELKQRGYRIVHVVPDGQRSVPPPPLPSPPADLVASAPPSAPVRRPPAPIEPRAMPLPVMSAEPAPLPVVYMRPAVLVDERSLPPLRRPSRTYERLYMPRELRGAR